MAITATIQTTSDYVKIVDAGETYVIQNISQEPVEIIFRDADTPAPANTERGHSLLQKDGAISAWGDGYIFIRSNDAKGIIVVTK